MGKKDLGFTLAFWLNMLTAILFITGFANTHWVLHSRGETGLWQKCYEDDNATKVSEPKKECSQSPLAEGPAFLDAARTLSCFSLVLFIVGSFGYMYADSAKQGNTGRARIQETCYFLAAVLAISAVSIYGDGYYDHHSKTLEDISLGVAFYLAAVAGGITFVTSIVMWVSRDVTPLPFKPQTTPKSSSNKEPKETNANERKNWLMDKSIPTPSQQKEPGKSENEVKVEEEPVPVKRGLITSVVAPTMVILAMKRLKNGEKRRSKDAEETVTVSPPTPPPAYDPDKYKGIFTVKVDNSRDDKEERQPRVVPPPIIQRKDSITSTSSSGTSSSSDISVVDEKAGHVTKLTGGQNAKKKDGLQRPLQPRRHFSQNDASLRAKAAESAVVVTDSDHLKDADRLPAPSQLRRHMTQQESTLRDSTLVADGNSSGNVNIYTIPPEPEAAPTGAPPSYD